MNCRDNSAFHLRRSRNSEKLYYGGQVAKEELHRSYASADKPAFAKEDLHRSYASAGKPTFIIKTLGCKVNQYETQAMREKLLSGGFREETSEGSSDFVIINSCTVTQKADKDARNLISHFNKINPKSKIVVAGCYAELEKDRSLLGSTPGVLHLIRNSEKARVASILKENYKLQIPNHKQITNYKFQITKFKDHNRAFVKIQDGCNHRCSYCKVPLVRGMSKSRKRNEILKEIETLTGNGFKEIVLTGICLGAWGRDLKEKIKLSSLIKDICGIDGNFRIRLSSIEPTYVSDDIIEGMEKNDKICKHLHIPMQSGDDRILKLMKRPYTAKKFIQLIRKIRKRIPNISFTTDILIGFPGENERSFHSTVKCIKKTVPSRMHVFSYSQRAGTASARFGSDLSRETIKKMVKTLVDLSKEFSMVFAGKFIGQYQNTIIEDSKDKRTGLLTGYTDRYIKVLLDAPEEFKNRMIPVKIERVDEENYTVFGCLDNSNII